MKNNSIANGYKALGKRIAKFRKENGLSQIQLAKNIGISQQLLANYELGQRRIHALLLLKLSYSLYVTLDDLLGIRSKINKPGPIPKIQRKLEEIKHLPLNKQKLILESLDTLIKGAK